MASPSHIVKKVVYGVCIALLFLPMLQMKWGWVEEKPLEGAVVDAPEPEIGLQNWLEDSLQSQTERYLNDHFGFRRTFVRFNNELGYRLFRTARANRVIVGKKGWLFEKDYFNSMLGADYNGEEANRRIAERMKRLQDTLAANGKMFLMIQAPSKAYHHPEYIPDRFRPEDSIPNNYKDLTRFWKEAGVEHLDCNAWFRAMKDTSRYLLYPKAGIHWSNYGKLLFVDSLLKRIEARFQADIPDVVWDGITVLDTPKAEDRDIEAGLNLLFPIDNEPMAYPNYRIEWENKRRLENLTVADSYWWGIFGTGMAGLIFMEPEFWYYNRERHSTIERGDTPIADLDLARVIAEKEVVIILCTDTKLDELGWGFIDRVVDDPGFGERLRTETLKWTMEAIRESGDRMQQVREEAENRGISVDSSLVEVAKRQIAGILH